jgi:type II secretory pathway pseudopilin PulG
MTVVVTSPHRAVPWDRHGVPADRDAGLTLVETVVTMGIMAVVMAILGAGMSEIRSQANRIEATSLAQGQLHVAFQRLDRDLRYAVGISTPAVVGGSTFVEYALTRGGAVDCTQLRYEPSTGVLHSRRRLGAGSVGRWSAVASYLVPPTGFQLAPASTKGGRHQQLEVTLAMLADRARPATMRQATVRFTALNTSVDTVSDKVCVGMERT